jgi:hypothetical protein
MIFKDHNFTENFCNAVGYKDEGMMRDIILDELSRLIVNEKADVVKLLRGNGINVSVNDNDLVISNVVTNEISKGNEIIIKGISDLITKNQFDQKKYESFMSADAKTDPKKKTSLFNTLKGVVKDENVQESISTLAANKLKKIFNKETPDTTAQNNANVNERLKMSQAANTKKKINTKAILIVVAIVVVVGIVGVKLYKSRQTSIS